MEDEYAAAEGDYMTIYALSDPELLEWEKEVNDFLTPPRMVLYQPPLSMTINWQQQYALEGLHYDTTAAITTDQRAFLLLGMFLVSHARIDCVTFFRRRNTMNHKNIHFSRHEP